MAVKKSRKFPSFVISSYFEDSAFTAFKRDVTFQTRYVNEAPLILSREGIGMGNLFCPYQQAKFRQEAVVLFSQSNETLVKRLNCAN